MFYLLEGAGEGILSHFDHQKGVQEGYFFKRQGIQTQLEIKKIKISYAPSYVSKMCYFVLVHVAWVRARMVRTPLSK